MQTDAFAQHKSKESRLLWYCILLVAASLLFLSPRVLSGDSTEYLSAAVRAKHLIHPHHLAYALMLRFFLILGAGVGLADIPYFILRMGMIAISILGLIATYRFLRFLHISRSVASLSALLTAVSGLYWQFSTQMEANIAAYAVLALAGCASLSLARNALKKKAKVADRATVHAGYFLFPVWRFLASALLIAFATTLHQACALVAPAFGLLVYIAIRRSKEQSGRSAASLSIALLTVSGLFSLIFYVVGWSVSGAGMPFLFWITKYAHWEVMPWGMISNFSVQGIKQLLLSWGASWFNVTPLAFFSPMPGSYGLLAVCSALFIGSLLVILLVGAVRGCALCAHAYWIALWISSFEIFILWWTPFLKNFQALVLLPQVALIALSAERFSRLLRRRKPSPPYANVIASAPRITLALLACVLIVMNGTTLILPGLKDHRLAPEGDLLIVRQFLREGDLCVLEWPYYNIMNSLLSYENTATVYQMVDETNFPSWKTDPRDYHKKIIFHHSSIFLSGIGLERAKKTYEDIWVKCLHNLETAAGGISNIRGSVLTNEAGLLFAIVGVDSQLPLTGQQVYMSLAHAAENAPLGVPRNIDRIFLSRVPDSVKLERLVARQTAARASGELPEVLHLRFTDSAQKPLWFKEGDADSISVHKDFIRLHSKGRYPIIRTALQPPRDISSFSRLSIEASIKPKNHDRGSADRDSDIQIIFHYEGEPLSENRSIVIPWKADGKRHRKSVHLWEHAFYIKPRKAVGLRLDPGDIPDSTIEIWDISFHAEPPSFGSESKQK